TPYYVAPPLILALAIASRQGRKRFWAATLIALETMVFAYHYLSPWAWWLPVVAGTAAVIALGFPNRSPAVTELSTPPASGDRPVVPEVGPVIPEVDRGAVAAGASAHSLQTV